jgi:hypothetical protein
VSKRAQGTLRSLGIYGLWVVLGALAALTAYQLYGTLLYVGLLVVEDPNLRPPGWNTATIYGLSRFLVLVLGICWLLVTSFVINYLGENIKPRQLWRRVLWSVLSMGALYGISFGVTVLLKE